MRRHSKMLLAVITLLWLTAPICAAEVRGRVYLDANKNGKADPGERGIAGVLVSDGLTVVATADNGSYQFPLAETPVIVRMSRPEGYAPSGSFWQTTDGTGAVDFGLLEEKQPDDFFFVHVTDSHLGRLDAFKEFAARINQFPLPLAFTINTGDLVGGVDTVPIEAAKTQYDSYLEGAAEFQGTLLNLPGNHEHVAIHRKDADQNHPWYGKGLYRELLGPVYHSWDYAHVHFIALDGTTLPYQERLGERQLAWLKNDLALTPKERPVVLFCHQSLLTIRDGKELFDLLEGRKVLAGFCGHLHETFERNRRDTPIVHTGALSGAWWSGANPDGTPQGFRLVHIKGAELTSAYTDRQGHHSLYVRSPDSKEIHSGAMHLEVVVLDYGTAAPMKVQAKLGETTTDLKLASRQSAWSTWQGMLVTPFVFDGLADVEVAVTADGQTDRSTTQYLVVNDRPAPFDAQGPAVLKMMVRNVNAVGEVDFNGQPLGTIPADTPNETTLEFSIPADRLQKLNRVTLRAGLTPDQKQGRFNTGSVWLEYQGRRLHDIRYVSFRRYNVGVSTPDKPNGKVELIYCLP